MSSELASKYQSDVVEAEVAGKWRDGKAFAAQVEGEGAPFCIVIPPPNVTAALHMGHALNNTLQDVLTRFRRMQGRRALWMPGTDHAGIATQTVVDKRLQAEGQPALKEYKQREAAGQGGREQFITKVQAWKDEYEARITSQLVAMGCSCDWDRQRFTMDEVCAAAVREAFFQLFKDGLIYRGKRLVNWDPVTQTALADDEVENEEIDGNFYYLRYPLVDPATPNECITVATTRPETMLGDTAVAVNPRDPQRAKYIGMKVRLPIVGREVPIIGDEYVVIPDPDSVDAKARFASGFLKVTPAHDFNDFEIGKRHNLPVINVMARDASISKDHDWTDWNSCDQKELEPLLGLSREDARKAIVRWFKDHDLLAEIKPYRHSVGHSYRSHVPVEPYLSDQWYVKVTDPRLAGTALQAMTPDQRDANGKCVWTENAEHPFKQPSAIPSPSRQGGGEPADWQGQLRFYPPRYARTFQQWHENIRDWCISRQLWWGHRIPVWSYITHGIWEESPEGKKEAEALKKFEQRKDRWIADDRLACIERKMSDLGPIDQVGVKDAVRFYCVRREDDAEIIDLLEAAGYTQDPDVLDTWFSSALWPISTLGWPDPRKFPGAIPEGELALNTWNPSNVLCTAREIITLWVSRMVMFNLYLRGCLPFTDVFIHAMIQDGHGQKMSKSLGNGVDPVDIIHSHGADAMRFTLASMTTQTQDVRMPVDMVCPHTSQSFTPKFVDDGSGHKVAAPVQDSPFAPGKKITSSYGVSSGKAKATDDAPAARNTSEKFDLGRNFANKLWNAVRFALGNLPPEGVAPSPVERAQLTLADRWILSRLARTIAAADAALESYEFKPYADGLYDFIWRDFCDWYIESIKSTVRTSVPQQRVLTTCIDVMLRLLHPVMPFVTEKLWARLNDVAPERGLADLKLPASELLVQAQWPAETPALVDEAAERDYARVQLAVTLLRELRTNAKLPPRQNADASLKCAAGEAAVLSAGQPLIEALATVTLRGISPDQPRPDDAASNIREGLEAYLHGVLDAGAERARLTKRIEEVTKAIANLTGRLNNKGYTDRAPAHLVQQTRDQLTTAEAELATLQRQLAQLA